MQTARYSEGHLSVWRGADVLTFIDGLSTNRVHDLRKGECKQTTFTTTTAKVIDRVALFHMGEFVACVSHAPFWQTHPKQQNELLQFEHIPTFKLLIQVSLAYKNIHGHLF